MELRTVYYLASETRVPSVHFIRLSVICFLSRTAWYGLLTNIVLEMFFTACLKSQKVGPPRLQGTVYFTRVSNARYCVFHKSAMQGTVYSTRVSNTRYCVFHKSQQCKVLCISQESAMQGTVYFTRVSSARYCVFHKSQQCAKVN